MICGEYKSEENKMVLLLFFFSLSISPKQLQSLFAW